MRGTLRTAAAAGFLFVLGASAVVGQTRVVLGVGGGAILPSKSSFEPPPVKSVGYHAQVMFGIAPSAGKVSARFDGQYASLNYEQQVSGARPKDKIFVVNADVVLHPGGNGAVRPYLMAGPTYGHFSFRNGLTGTAGNNVSTNNVGFNGGAGLNMGSGAKVWFFIESRYIYTKDHKYIPVTVGVRINTGQPYTRK